MKEKKLMCSICKDEHRTKKDLIRCLSWHLKDAQREASDAICLFNRANSTVKDVASQLINLLS